MENKYKCENHKLDIVCLPCSIAIYNKYKRLLEFANLANSYSCENILCICLSCEAFKTLREIGEIA